jgi:hypothetical protein
MSLRSSTDRCLNLLLMCLPSPLSLGVALQV